MSEVDEEQPRTGVSWMQVAGSALAAVSSAVVLSTLGVAGTVIGAALGSVVATLGTALYTRTLDASRQQVAAQAAALRRVTRARSELDEVVAAGRRGAVSGTGLARAGRELDEAQEALAATAPDDRSDHSAGGGLAGTRGPQPGGLAALAARLSWKRLAAVAAAVFLVAMLAITGFELLTGQAVSQLTGGTDTPTRSTVPGLGSSESRTPSPTADPTGGSSPSESPTTDPTTDPTSDPTSDPTASTTEEPAPTSSPTDVPTPSGTPTPTPTAPTPSSTPTSDGSPAVAEPPAVSELPGGAPSGAASGGAGGAAGGAAGAGPGESPSSTGDAATGG